VLDLVNGRDAMKVLAPQVGYDAVDAMLDVPAPGRLLMTQQPEPTVRSPTTGGSRTGSESDVQASPAPTQVAMAWGERLGWNGRTGELRALGGVRVGLERGPDDADRIRATFDQLVARTTPLRDADPSTMRQQIELLDARAIGGVQVRSQRASFDAAELMFDAATETAQAISLPLQPVEVFDERGLSKLSFSALRWNVKTGLIDELKDVDGRFRPMSE
jgi:hypothetical protein